MVRPAHEVGTHEAPVSRTIPVHYPSSTLSSSARPLRPAPSWLPVLASAYWHRHVVANTSIKRQVSACAQKWSSQLVVIKATGPDRLHAESARIAPRQ